MAIKMVAKERIRYPFLGPEAREYAPGEEFEIREADDLLERRHAEALQACDKATIVKEEKKRYSRRDLRAEQ